MQLENDKMRIDLSLAVIATLMLFVVVLGGCAGNPPLPPNLPLPRADLMVRPVPLPTLPENKSVELNAFYAHAAELRGQCVMDRTRLDHLQQYVGKLTGK